MTAELAEAHADHAVGDSRTRGRSGLGRALLTGAAVVALVGAMAGTASAAPGDTSTDTVDANVGVSSSISLTGLPGSFTLNGIPGSTVTGGADVGFLVTTNNFGGYSVGVLSEGTELLPPNPGPLPLNPDTIPIANLSVRETGTATFTPLDTVTPVVVGGGTAASAAGGDAITNDYRVVIPLVRSATYTVTLDYVATAL